MVVSTTPRTTVSECWRVLPTRVRTAGLVVVLLVAAELWTAVPGFRLLLAAVVVCAPALLFVRFWRVLLWLGDSSLDDTLARRYRRDWHGRTVLWMAFAVLWTLDVVATVWFFLVPTARELHPVTVFLYQVVGIPGVVFAGAFYATLVVALVRALPEPLDFDVLFATSLWTGILVVHNYVLLLGGKT